MADSAYTFLFTDVEGSTRLWDRSPDLSAHLIAEQDRVIREAVTDHQGRVFASGGDGVAVVFSDPANAVAAAIQAQLDLRSSPEALAVRIGIHLGPALERNNDFFGATVNRAARIMGAAHGGQVLISEAVAGRVQPEGFVLKDLGSHLLRDLTEPERIFQVCHQELPERFPPLRSLGSYRNNLPVGLPVLLGRDQDLEAVAESLLDHVILTVVGTGGVGKTRFALQVAADVLDRYPGGAWIIELATLNPDGDVAPAIVETLGLETSEEGPDADRVIEFIGQQAILLILDNCEHVLTPVAEMVRQLIRRCGHLRILATSRERLHLPEEQVYDLAPLEVPRVGVDAAAVATVPAVQLLIQRATEGGASDPFMADPQATASICRRVDGLPLAVELAASRLRVMSVGDLDASLSRGLKLLAARRVTGPSHHATMTATIDWSYRLLHTETQRFLTRLGVLMGGFDLAAAVTVGGIGSPDDAIELLTYLVEASLVVHVPTGRVSRYRLLEPIRQYALARLADDEGEDRDARDRHARHFRGLAVEAESHMLGHGQAAYMSRLDADYDNIRAALSWLADTDPGDYFDLATALAAYWLNRGLLREGKAVLESALSANPEASTRRIDALIGMASICWVGSDYERGEEAAAMALAMAKAEGDRPRSVIATQCLARLWLFSGRVDKAAVSMEWVRSTAKELGMGRWVGEANNLLGHVARRVGDFEGAQLLHRTAREEFQSAGDEVGVSYALASEGVDVWQLRQFGLAHDLMVAANRIQLRLGDSRGAAEGKAFEALLELEAGDLEAARDLATNSVRELRDIGYRRGLTGALMVLSRIESAMGNHRNGALLIGAAEAIFGRDLSELPVFGGGEAITILRREMGAEFEATINQGRAMGWDGLHQWLENEQFRGAIRTG